MLIKNIYTREETVGGIPTARNGPSRFHSNCQSELFYQAWIPSRPQLIVVGLHGAGQHSGWFGPLATHLVSQRMALYALDLRGFGRSSGLRGHVDRFENYLEDVDRFIHGIRSQLPSLPIILLGHSFGGTVAIRYAQERSTPIQALVVSAPALRIRLMIPPALDALIATISRIAPMTSIDVTGWSRVFFRDPPNHAIDTFQKVSQRDPWNTTRFSVRWLTELLINGTQALRRASQLRIPVLSFCSEDDALVDPWAVHQFYRALMGCHSQHLAFCQRPHDWILHDNGKDPLYAYVVQWIKTQSLP
ncbi:MAG TPA: hypothetical protein DD856_14495 [Sulfobacillus sp.]|nr:hypothetical protein [Sulfobacillus sp.]